MAVVLHIPEVRLIWKMLAFLAGQTGVLYLLIKAAH
jgi:hypothetical protein